MNRRNAIIGGTALAVLLATFLAGRYSRAPQVVTKDVVRTQTVEVEHVKTVTVHDVAEAKAAEEKVRTVTVTKYRWLPGGVTEAETTTTRAKDSDSHETKQASTKVEKQADASRSATVVELHTSTPVRPTWSFGVSGGVARDHAVPIFGPVIVGGQIGHRIGGPFSVDLSGNTSPAVLLTLRIDL